MKWELAIQIEDKSGDRAKKGDIIAVQPYPWQWGKLEEDHYLIVVVDGLTEKEARELSLPLYEKEITAEIRENRILAKRRNKIDFDKLKTIVPIDEVKLADRSIVYQPLKERSFEVSELGDLELLYDKKDNKFKKVKK